MGVFEFVGLIGHYWAGLSLALDSGVVLFLG